MRPFIIAEVEKDGHAGQLSSIGLWDSAPMGVRGHGSEPSRQTVALGCEKTMVKTQRVKSIPRTKEERKHARKSLGILKSSTVQPKTKGRYQEALDSLYGYLRKEGLTLPKLREGMDDMVSDYLEFMWSEGEGRAAASTFLAALQDAEPKLKGHLPGSWRLMKTWVANEVPSRAPPMSESVLRAMVGWAVLHEHEEFALSLLVAFYSFLRTGELLGLQAWQIHMQNSSTPAVLNLGLTKSGKRQGAAESVTLTEQSVLKLLWSWKQTAHPHSFWTAKPHIWRDLFAQAVQSLKISQWEYRPYSLRRGGATHFFVKCGSLDKVLILGRWTALKTAKIYLNSGLAMLTDLQIPNQLLSPFHTIYQKWIQSKPSLEHAPVSRRTGERGKRVKSKFRKDKSEFYCPGGGAVFFLSFRSSVARLGFSWVWPEPQGTQGAIYSQGLAGNELLCPKKAVGFLLGS